MSLLCSWCGSRVPQSLRFSPQEIKQIEAEEARARLEREAARKEKKKKKKDKKPATAPIPAADKMVPVAPPISTKAEYSWQYDEFKPVGRDYGDRAEVDVYDSSHADFRDLAAEHTAILDALALKPGDCVIDFGAGTGAFAMAAARMGLRVHAVDVSIAMLELARAKAEAEALTDISFHHAGFLSYSHCGDAADAIVTTFALHHLPDFWKGVALQRMQRMLKPGGRLYLHDVIMRDFADLQAIDAFIAGQEAAGGSFLREDAEGHFRDEFSTYGWVIDGMLERAGFGLLKKTTSGGVLATYLCERL